MQLTQRDALGAHTRDELGISETVTAHPIQAALVSGVTFALGAMVPLAIATLTPVAQITSLKYFGVTSVWAEIPARRRDLGRVCPTLTSFIYMA